MTLSEWLDRWLEQMSLTLRPDTLKRYRGDMDRHVKPRLGQKRLTQLTAEDLRELYCFLLEQGRIAPPPGQGPASLRHCPRYPRCPPPSPSSGIRPVPDTQQPRQTGGPA